MPKKTFVQEKPIIDDRPGPGPKSNLNSLTPDGREIVSNVPIAPPIGYIKQPTLHERIRDMVRSEQLRQAAEGAGYETFDEADDFAVGDDHDPSSPYEQDFDPAPPPGPPEAAPTAPQASLATPPPANEPATTPATPETLPEHNPGGGPGVGGSQATPPAPGPLGRLLRPKK